MTAAEARRRLVRELSAAGVLSPGLEADMILSFSCGVSSAFLRARPDFELTEENLSKLMRVSERRSRREPLQYILGSWDFFGRTLATPPGVLIPRPETELLVERALERLPQEGGVVLDWGTGSGCIALSLLCENTSLFVVAADSNPRALRTSWNTLKQWGVLSRCLLWHSRAPDDIPVSRASLDMLVSNPPYIPTHRLASLMEEVRYEPLSALDGGIDGADCYRRLFIAGEWMLRSGGSLLFEAGDGEQIAYLADIAPDCFELDGIFEDFSKSPRVIAWRRV